MGKRLTKITTRSGDDGTTALSDGIRIKKNHLRIITIGALDELNAHFGVLLCYPMPSPIEELLFDIQQNLFNLGGELSAPAFHLLSPENLLQLDHAIEHYNAQLPTLKEFILPGGTPVAAQTHVCRTVIRRAEQNLVALGSTEYVRPLLYQYLNRLSDIMFILARTLNQADKSKPTEVYWQSERLQSHT
jgi:cob(I)alamin adenosyltransferase